MRISTKFVLEISGNEGTSGQRQTAEDSDIVGGIERNSGRKGTLPDLPLAEAVAQFPFQLVANLG
jgi:hypothetical protein